VDTGLKLARDDCIKHAFKETALASVGLVLGPLSPVSTTRVDGPS